VDRDARSRHGRIDADPGLSAEERTLVLEARQAVERDLDRVGQDVESLEAVDARSGLPEPTGENPGIEQIEDGRGVGEEAVLARAGEHRLTRR
jgi:hypothetical protein